MSERLYNKNVVCPICQNKFETAKVRHEWIRVLKRDTDLQEYFKEENPYFYEINVCPGCGFSFSDNFNEKLSDAQIDRFKKAVSNQWKKADYGGERDANEGIEVYKLALLSAQVLGLKNSTIAGILLRICWLNRILGNHAEEKRFMGGAAEFYEKAYEMEDADTGESLRPEIILYLLGELNYRLGKNPEAVKWFSSAISKCNSDPSVKPRTVNMIRDRWMDIKNEKDRPQ
jgi:uncharacterized protein (DUF2225 family)